MKPDENLPEEFDLDFMVKGLLVILIIAMTCGWYIIDWIKQLF